MTKCKNCGHEIYKHHHGYGYTCKTCDCTNPEPKEVIEVEQ